MRSFLKKYIGDLFFGRRFYFILSAAVILFIFRFFVPWLGIIPFVFLFAIFLLVIIDYLFLFSNRKGVFAARSHAERLSNGDENPVRLDVESYYSVAVSAEIIDEIPHQFQRRDVSFHLQLPAGSRKIIDYSLRPVKRGEYAFGNINL